MRRFAPLFVLALISFGCTGNSDSPVKEEEAEDSHGMVLEGSSIEAGSDPIEAEAPFARLGVIWDAVDEDAIELRTSADGAATWSEWETPEVVYVENEAHAGRLDVVVRATHFQYRVAAGKSTPTYIVFDPIEEMPEIIEGTVLEPEEEMDATDTSAGGLAGDHTIHRRSEWSKRAPRCVTAMTPYRATIHHTAGPNNDTLSVPARLRQVQSYHMDVRGWCDIAYNYLVSRDGRLWQGRGARRQGGHVYDENSGNVGICFIGTYTSLEPSERQLCNAGWLLGWVHRNWPAVHLDRNDVFGHRQYGARFGSTECPGNKLYAKIPRIIDIAKTPCAR